MLVFEDKSMVRKAEKKDIERIMQLLEQVLTVHADGRPDIFISGTTKYTPKELEDIINSPNTPVFVYADENDVAQGHAFCIFEETKNANNLHDMKSLYIDDICVDADHRRQHIASDLYEHVKAFAKESGCYHMTLNVWSCNPGALEFYRSMGMKPMKTVMEAIL